MLRKATCGICFFCAFIGNPFGIGCGSSSNEFTYGEQDMERAVVGTYSGPATDGGTGETYTLTITRSSAATATQTSPLRLQCTSRTFVKPAGACSPASVMFLNGELQSDQQATPVQLMGEYMAFHTLIGGVDFMGPDHVHISATYDGNRLAGWSYMRSDGAVLSLDLQRK